MHTSHPLNVILWCQVPSIEFCYRSVSTEPSRGKPSFTPSRYSRNISQPLTHCPISKLGRKDNVAFYLDFSVCKTVYQHKFKFDKPLACHKNTRCLAISQTLYQMQLGQMTIKVRLSKESPVQTLRIYRGNQRCSSVVEGTVYVCVPGPGFDSGTTKI